MQLLHIVRNLISCDFKINGNICFGWKGVLVQKITRVRILQKIVVPQNLSIEHGKEQQSALIIFVPVSWVNAAPQQYSISQEICTRFLLCCALLWLYIDFPISIRFTSLALWKSNDCPSASKATLMNMDKYFMWIHYERLHNHHKAKHNKTMCIFLGIYCISSFPDYCGQPHGTARLCGNRQRGQWSKLTPQMAQQNPLQSHHNERAGVSNHRRLDWLLSRLFRRRSKKTSLPRVAGLCEGNSPVIVNSPHKEPVTLKMFPFDQRPNHATNSAEGPA